MKKKHSIRVGVNAEEYYAYVGIHSKSLCLNLDGCSVLADGVLIEFDEGVELLSDTGCPLEPPQVCPDDCHT